MSIEAHTNFFKAANSSLKLIYIFGIIALQINLLFDILHLVDYAFNLQFGKN